MQRRTFISLFSGAAAGSSGSLRAQQKAVPVIGFLSGGSAAPNGAKGHEDPISLRRLDGRSRFS